MGEERAWRSSPRSSGYRGSEADHQKRAGRGRGGTCNSIGRSPERPFSWSESRTTIGAASPPARGGYLHSTPIQVQQSGLAVGPSHPVTFNHGPLPIHTASEHGAEGKGDNQPGVGHSGDTEVASSGRTLRVTRTL